MIHWMDSLSPGPLRDAFYELGTRLVASQNKYKKAATYADGISDPEKRLAARASPDLHRLSRIFG